MSACPVCETQNLVGALECATCGKALARVAIADAPAATMEELENARVDSAAIAVQPEPMPELDLARASPVNVIAEATPDIDLGRNAEVGEVATERPAEMEDTAIALKEWTPEAQGPVLCRACGTPQSDESSVFCANCGRHLPVRAPIEGAIIVGEVKAGAPERVKCFSCGARVIPADLCSDCGTPMRHG